MRERILSVDEVLASPEFKAATDFRVALYCRMVEKIKQEGRLTFNVAEAKEYNQESQRVYAAAFEMHGWTPNEFAAALLTNDMQFDILK